MVKLLVTYKKGKGVKRMVKGIADNLNTKIKTDMGFHSIKSAKIINDEQRKRIKKLR